MARGGGGDLAHVRAKVVVFLAVTEGIDGVGHGLGKVRHVGPRLSVDDPELGPLFQRGGMGLTQGVQPTV